MKGRGGVLGGVIGDGGWAGQRARRNQEEEICKNTNGILEIPKNNLRAINFKTLLSSYPLLPELKCISTWVGG